MRFGAVACFLSSAFVIAASQGEARAQSSGIPDTNWRQRDRTEHVARIDDSYRPHFALEVRFAPYYPQVDDAPGLAKRAVPGGSAPVGPFEQVFGSGPQFYFGLEFDWQALRIPWVGSVGPGFGIGYTNRTAQALINAPGHGTGGCHRGVDGCHSAEDTSLMIVPMQWLVVFRFDGPMRKLRVPVVPYVKAGVGMGLWEASSDADKSYSSPPGRPAEVGFASSGVTWGYHLAIGGMLLLNWLDPGSVARARAGGDAANFYLFGEWMDAGLRGLGSQNQLWVGTSTGVVGLAVDM
jgi:hypothetical protein